MTNLTGAEYARICAIYNLPISKNWIGDSGEKILGFAFSYFPFFNTYFLDGKAPVEDFVCELIDNNKPYPFYVQVKTTEKGTDNKGNLLATLPKDKKLALISRPIPTYLAGVDLHKITVYICPVFDPNQAYGTIPPTHIIQFDDLDLWAKELKSLKDDIVNYWDNHTNSVSMKSSYKSIL